jgi:hypothetical protein
MANENTEFVLCFKCAVEDLGRIKSVFQTRSDFPTVTGIDMVVICKADARASVMKDMRSKDIEALVSWVFMVCMGSVCLHECTCAFAFGSEH